MFPKKNLFVFDIETVIDTKMAKTFLKLDENITDDEAINELDKYHLKLTDGKNSFARQLFHKVVTIAFLHAEITHYPNGQEHYNLIDLRAGGKESFTESELISSFLNYLSSLQARLVTFNGRMFDMPVLKYRAMRHGISADWLYKGGDKWNNYQSRYCADWHCDLLEVLSDYGASAKIKLDEVCVLINAPGKMDIDGSDVKDLFYTGKISTIRDYCELDVANTYLVYLSHMRHIGALNNKDYDAIIEDLQNFMYKNSEVKPHYERFLNKWNL